jgi:hypothetical protein
VTLAKRADLDGYYTVFGRVISGTDVPATMERGDVITRMTCASEIHRPDELRIPLEKFRRILTFQRLPQLLLDHAAFATDFAEK